jgi:hypothetical protein
LAKRYPENPFLAKVEGMVRFYEQGKMSLDQQELPDCLLTVKNAIPDK